MKQKIITIIILIIISMIGCEFHNQEINDPSDIIVQNDYTYDFENDIDVPNLKMALSYARNIKYLRDKENHDYWQTPEETYNLKTGDCEDFAIFLLYIVWTKLNIDDCYLVLINKDNKGCHAIVQIDGTYYEPQIGYEVHNLTDDDILCKAHYTEVIWMTENYHNNVGKYY